MQGMKRVAAAIAVISALASAAPCTQINLLYNERPPYMVTTTRGVRGVTASMVTQVFATARIDAKWIQIPFLRQLKTIETNQGCDCMAAKIIEDRPRFWAS